MCGRTGARSAFSVAGKGLMVSPRVYTYVDLHVVKVRFEEIAQVNRSSIGRMTASKPLEITCDLRPSEKCPFSAKSVYF